MLIRTLIIVAFLATPLASSAANFDLTKAAGSAAKIVKTLDSDDGVFQSHRRWRRHRHGPKPPTNGKPVGAVPEPTAALLFGLGAVALGVGIRRRR